MSILLPHSDDELFILPFVEEQLLQGILVKIFFITSDFNPLREGESNKTLSHLAGVEICQFGILNNVRDGKLSHSSADVFTLLEKDSSILASDILVTPIFEGGHVDHDEIFKIGYALALKYKKMHLCFSLYNSYSTPLVRVATIFQGPVKGNLQTVTFSFRKGLSYLRKSFYYKSQYVVLAILFPGLVRTFILKRKIHILEVTDFNPNLPHPGRVFHSNPWKTKIKSILGLT